jgi:hypothetical protein
LDRLEKYDVAVLSGTDKGSSSGGQKMKSILTTVIFFVVVLIFLQAQAGAFYVEVDDMVFSLGRVKVTGPLGYSETIFEGGARMLVYFEGDEGVADDDNGNGLDEVNAQIINFEMTSMTLLYGPIRLREHPGITTMGKIEEVTNDIPGILEVTQFSITGKAEMYFDMFFEVEMGGKLYYSDSPIRHWYLIEHKPPEDGFEFFQSLVTVQLVDTYGLPTGFALWFDWNTDNYAIETDVYESCTGEIEIWDMESLAEVVDVSGEITQVVFFEDVDEGSAYTDDFDRREEVQMGLQELGLKGMNPTLGSIRLTLKRDSISLGEIEETAANTFGILDIPPFTPTGTAANTMEVYFEVGMGLNLYVTFDPILLEGVMTHKPSISGEIFTSADYVRLYEVTGLPSQYSMRVAWLVLSPCVRCGDFDGDGLVDMLDYGEFAGKWKWSQSGVDQYNAADMNCDRVVGIQDLSDFILMWLGDCS